MANKALLFASLVTVLVTQGASQRRGPNNGNDEAVSETSPGEHVFPVIDVAKKARISAAFTCGYEKGYEEYCLVADHVAGASDRAVTRHCQNCSLEENPIESAIDGSPKVWLSPTLARGIKYHQNNITIDLQQVYQVTYIHIRFGISPRFGMWILEKSVDNVDYYPWAFFGINKRDCNTYERRYKENFPEYANTTMQAIADNNQPNELRNDEVVCYYGSSIVPLQNAELSLSLMNNRRFMNEFQRSGNQSVLILPEDFKNFTMARYIRFRLHRMRTLPSDTFLARNDTRQSSIYRRYFYSLRDVAVGGSCMCFGYTQECPPDESGEPRCVCSFDTQGKNCEQCLPMYNHKAWRPFTGNPNDVPCQECYCNEHADECVYNATVERLGSVRNRAGLVGGGVCLCQDNTDGYQCEKCARDYFLPADRQIIERDACQQCGCADTENSLGDCYRSTDEATAANLVRSEKDAVQPGDCKCNEGFAGARCDRCAIGYRNYPNCEPCRCNLNGTSDLENCETCACKSNVEGELCDQCKAGYFNLDRRNPDGCSKCECFGITDNCTSQPTPVWKITTLEQWKLTGLRSIEKHQNDPGFSAVNASAARGRPSILQSSLENVKQNDVNLSDVNVFYWLAPDRYAGNRLNSYGTDLEYSLNINVADLEAQPDYQQGYSVIIQSKFASIGFMHNEPSDENTPNFRQPKTGEAVQFRVPLSDSSMVGTWYVLESLLPLEYIGSAGSSVAEFREYEERYPYADEIRRRSKRQAQEPTEETEPSEPAAEENVDQPSEEATEETPEPEPETTIEPVTQFVPTLASVEQNQVASKQILMSVLSDVQRILIRATYFSNQEEVQLNDFTLYIAKDNVTQDSSTIATSLTSGGVEQCSCPPGYAGYSCESCAPGYRRVNNQLVGGQCVKCMCNNHAQTCDAYTGLCEAQCGDNTKGAFCDSCSDRYYGNATFGSLDDCKPCGCPLTNDANFFAEKCASITNENNVADWVCVNCSVGYSGSKCEICDDGYFGNPLNGTCKACNCSGNIKSPDYDWCDRDTGKCLKCAGNSEGDNCERCKPGFFGRARNFGCMRCNCSKTGAVNETCDDRGRCTCKPGYTGSKCDRCDLNRGNFEGGCPLCNCNLTGSVGTQCNQTNGQCTCRPNVAGLQCDQCQIGTWNLQSGTGCKTCNCNPRGSADGSCDPLTGQCKCKPNVVGARCDQCAPNFKWLPDNSGCTACGCHSVGSVEREQQCDPETGVCECKFGVNANASCSTCLAGYYDLTNTGCKKCDRCPYDWQVCDAITGECKCPRKTGPPQKCNQCIEDSYGLNTVYGCSDCNCSLATANSLTCDNVTGQCPCKEQYDDRQCASCKFDRYDYPNCQSCQCNFGGTLASDCRTSSNSCRCNNTGSCSCRPLVTGTKCDSCAPYTFGLHADNDDGCLRCYCSRRSNNCTHLVFTWQRREIKQVKAPPARPFFIERGAIKASNERPASRVAYLKLNDVSGDLTASYGSTAEFSVEVNVQPASLTSKNALVLLERVDTDSKLSLQYSETTPYVKGSNSFNIVLREKYWRDSTNASIKVSRARFMYLLTSVTGFYIKASDGGNAFQATVTGSLAYAVNSSAPATDMAYTVEKCECPLGFTGLSCQEVAPGFFVNNTEGVPDDSTDTTGTTGGVISQELPRACSCNGHSSTCDPRSGVCTNCSHNTSGPFCEVCADGYIGDATLQTPDACRLCDCPTVVNGTLPTCRYIDVRGRQELKCNQCPTGSEGNRCDQCSNGYYEVNGGSRNYASGGYCVSCKCDRDGAANQTCNKQTGQCACLPGLRGRDCSECGENTIPVRGKCERCDKGCTLLLMKSLDILEETLQTKYNRTRDVPIARLNTSEARLQQLRMQIDEQKNNVPNNLIKYALGSVRNASTQANASWQETEQVCDAVQSRVAQHLTDIRMLNASIAITSLHIEQEFRLYDDVTNALYDVGNAESANESLQAALADAASMLSSSQQSLAILNRSSTEMNKIINAMKAPTEDVRNAHTATLKRYGEMMAVYSDQEAKIKQFMKQADADVTVAAATISTIGERISEFPTANATLTVRMAEVNNMSANSSTFVSEITPKLQQNRDRLQAITQQQEEVKAELVRIRGEFDAMDAQVANLTASERNAKSYVEKLQRTLQLAYELQSRLQSFNASQSGETWTNLYGLIKKYLKVVGTLKGTAAELKESTEAIEKIAETRTFLTNAASENDQLSQLNSPARASVSRLLELTTRFVSDNRTGDLNEQLLNTRKRQSDLADSYGALSNSLNATSDRWTTRKANYDLQQLEEQSQLIQTYVNAYKQLSEFMQYSNMDNDAAAARIANMKVASLQSYTESKRNINSTETSWREEQKALLSSLANVRQKAQDVRSTLSRLGTVLNIRAKQTLPARVYDLPDVRLSATGLNNIEFVVQPKSLDTDQVLQLIDLGAKDNRLLLVVALRNQSPYVVALRDSEKLGESQSSVQLSTDRFYKVSVILSLARGMESNISVVASSSAIATPFEKLVDSIRNPRFLRFGDLASAPVVASSDLSRPSSPSSALYLGGVPTELQQRVANAGLQLNAFSGSLGEVHINNIHVNLFTSRSQSAQSVSSMADFTLAERQTLRNGSTVQSPASIEYHLNGDGGFAWQNLDSSIRDAWNLTFEYRAFQNDMFLFAIGGMDRLFFAKTLSEKVQLVQRDRRGASYEDKVLYTFRRPTDWNAAEWTSILLRYNVVSNRARMRITLRQTGVRDVSGDASIGQDLTEFEFMTIGDLPTNSTFFQYDRTNLSSFSGFLRNVRVTGASFDQPVIPNRFASLTSTSVAHMHGELSCAAAKPYSFAFRGDDEQEITLADASGATVLTRPTAGYLSFNVRAANVTEDTSIVEFQSSSLSVKFSLKDGNLDVELVPSATQNNVSLKAVSLLDGRERYVLLTSRNGNLSVFVDDMLLVWYSIPTSAPDAAASIVLGRKGDQAAAFRGVVSSIHANGKLFSYADIKVSATTIGDVGRFLLGRQLDLASHQRVLTEWLEAMRNQPALLKTGRPDADRITPTKLGHSTIVPHVGSRSAPRRVPTSVCLNETLMVRGNNSFYQFGLPNSFVKIVPTELRAFQLRLDVRLATTNVPLLTFARQNVGTVDFYLYEDQLYVNDQNTSISLSSGVVRTLQIAVADDNGFTRFTITVDQEETPAEVRVDLALLASSEASNTDGRFYILLGKLVQLRSDKNFFTQSYHGLMSFVQLNEEQIPTVERPMYVPGSEPTGDLVMFTPSMTVTYSSKLVASLNDTMIGSLAFYGTDAVSLTDEIDLNSEFKMDISFVAMHRYATLMSFYNPRTNEGIILRINKGSIEFVVRKGNSEEVVDTGPACPSDGTLLIIGRSSANYVYIRTGSRRFTPRQQVPTFTGKGRIILGGMPDFFYSGAPETLDTALSASNADVDWRLPFYGCVMKVELSQPHPASGVTPNTVTLSQIVKTQQPLAGGEIIVGYCPRARILQRRMIVKLKV